MVDQLTLDHLKGAPLSLFESTVQHVDEPQRGFDAYLGAAHNRYLGSGHRRVALQMSEPAQERALEFTCTARMTYPEDWSQKAGVERTPHLSTVDAIRIAGKVRASLTRHGSFAEFADERSLTVRAGARPWEQLGAVPVHTAVALDPEHDELVLQHSVGTLKVESRLARASDVPIVDEGWAPGEASDIRFDADRRVQCTYDRRATEPSLMSFLEAMMLAAQMSQVALYGGDPKARDRSGNMWMRRARFVRHTARPQSASVVDLQLQNRRNVMVGGRAIDTADVLADDVFGVQVSASLATES
ncbi:AvrD family protein [Curtobacterium sp. MCBA15_012]|uniref:AvrD family protein n=1 Tax=Curtobacterium sp. MCBA15_012 TaxID=1898738 RepID=UPI001587BC63|nr:AvrD family protein [Curtobacterium sp. MCBA15_012]WIB00318.1 AvrD family protein [Curtobacterium sp. MCBA15_012]